MPDKNDLIRKHEEGLRLLAENRALNDRRLAEKREFTAEETAEYTLREQAADALIDFCEKAKKQEEQEARLEASKPDDSFKFAATSERETAKRLDESLLFSAYLTGGGKFSNATTREFIKAHPQEVAGLQVDIDAQGGYFRPSEAWSSLFIQDLKNEVKIRQYAHVESTNGAESLNAYCETATMDDFSWTSEIGAAAEDTALRYGKRSLHPHRLAKLYKASRDFLRFSTRSADAIIREGFVYKVGVTEEQCFMQGTGANQPLGLFTASDNGITTSQDVNIGSTTNYTSDGLLNVLYDIKEPYRKNWLFHREALLLIRKLKDGQSQYIWQPGLQAGQPSVLLGLPVIESEYCPHVFTSALYTGMLGDFSNYWIADSMDMEIQVLNELYAANNQVGYICRKYTDGQPMKAEAFRRIKMSV